MKQECIPVGCVPSAAVLVSPATHAPLPCMPPPREHYPSATVVADGDKKLSNFIPEVSIHVVLITVNIDLINIYSSFPTEVWLHTKNGPLKKC